MTMNNPDRWGSPEYCQRLKRSGKTYYRVSIPKHWIRREIRELKAEYAIEQYCVILDDSRDWDWVKTDFSGAQKLLKKLGYTIFKPIPRSVWPSEINEKAKLHGIDMRFIDVEIVNVLANYMCLRNEEDAALLRLCIS